MEEETNTGTGSATGTATATETAKGLHITKEADEFVLTDGTNKVTLNPVGYVPEEVLHEWTGAINSALKAATSNKS